MQYSRANLTNLTTIAVENVSAVVAVSLSKENIHNVIMMTTPNLFLEDPEIQKVKTN